MGVSEGRSLLLLLLLRLKGQPNICKPTAAASSCKSQFSSDVTQLTTPLSEESNSSACADESKADGPLLTVLSPAILLIFFHTQSETQSRGDLSVGVVAVRWVG